MDQPNANLTPAIPLDRGSYTAAEAARLIRTSPRNVRRWLGGYAYSGGGERREVAPLWSSQLPMIEHHLEIGFRDLVELRFVKAFLDAGLGLLTIRNGLDYAREVVGDAYPFSTRRFLTDGRRIFLESVEQDGPRLLDLRERQYVFAEAIRATFRDLDLDDGVVGRWRPFGGKASIVIDPRRSFGQPIAARTGVPTVTLAEAVAAEGSVEEVARLYEVEPGVVRDAVAFERSLAA